MNYLILIEHNIIRTHLYVFFVNKINISINRQLYFIPIHEYFSKSLYIIL